MTTRTLTSLTFDKTANKVTFTGLKTLNIERLLYITDVTAGKVIYSAGIEGLKYQSVTGNYVILQLNTNNSNFDNADKLIAVYATDNLLIRQYSQVALAADTNTDDFECLGKGAIITINTSNKTLSASLVAKLQYKDYDGNYQDVPGAVTAAITTNTETKLFIYPGAVETANQRVSYGLTGTLRVNITLSGGTFDTKVYYSPLN